MQETGGASLIDATRQGKSRFWLFAFIALVSLAADQLTKAWALAHLTDGQSRPIIGTFLQFYLTFNPGAAFSTGTKFTWVFTSLAIIATFVVIRYAVTARSRAWAVSLGLLLGGITGNLTDRLTRPPEFFKGHVVDFLMLPHWPVFNVADMLIDTAAVLIVVLSFKGIKLDGTTSDE